MTPTPIRQGVNTFVSPRVQDFIRLEKWDTSREPIPTFGTPHKDIAKYPHHKLAHASPSANERGDDSAGRIYDVFYVAPREHQDDYNWEFTDADIGGTRFEAVRRSYVVLREEFSSTEPAQGSAMPNVPEDKFTGSYVLAERQQQRFSEHELDSLFVMEIRTYVKRCTIRQIGVDSLNGQNLYEDTTLFYRGETISSVAIETLFADVNNAYWGIQSDGTQRTGQQLSCNWFAVTTAQVVGGTFEGGVVTVDNYTTNRDYSWPAVLSALVFKTWSRNDGGVDIYPTVKFNPEGYNGPCQATVTRTWATSPFTIAKVDQMLPTRIYYACPFFTLNMSECLHPEVTAICDIGSEDPVYEVNVGSSETFAATNYTTWPDSITAYDNQEPYRGGYLRTEIEVFKPA